MKDTEKYEQQCLARQKAFYEKNKEKVLEYKKEYYQKKKQQTHERYLPIISA